VQPRLPRWPTWEVALLAVLFVLALLSRVWNLTNFPDNIYPDEIMTGTVATQSYLSPTTPPPSVFSTLWSGIDLPALWFWFVAAFLKLGGISLAMLRLPAALFGAATVISLYALLRGTWDRYPAIAGSTIMAFSVSNVHYSPLALNNIVTQFFWATCFFFLLRALRSRRPSDWALAGLSTGLSEYFYYGTRLLPFVLAMFMVFLLTVHWKHARQYASGFLLLAGSYFVGFGPLLFHFIRNPNLYLGRGANLLIWSPHTFRSVSPISTGPGKRFGQCCPRTCLESALTVHKTSCSIAHYSYLPKPLCSSWALPCFCDTGVIRPLFSYSPPG